MSEKVLPPSVLGRYERRGTAREAAKRAGLSVRTAQRWTSRPRAEWLAEQAAEREEIRAYHDDEGHTWEETAWHFGTSIYNVQKRAYRARKERAAEAATHAAATASPTLPLDNLSNPEH